MRHARSIVLFAFGLACTAFTLAQLIKQAMYSPVYAFPLLLTPLAIAYVDVNWYPPKDTWINNLDHVIKGTGTHGFYFGGSTLPRDTPYGTYNWCNMPHVRTQEYPRASKEFQLEYVEVVRKRPEFGLFYNGQPLNPIGNESARTYWNVYTSENNPFLPTGFNGTCQFPQITRGGLDDSWQHAKDLYGVYHDLLHFLPSDIDDRVVYRVTNNVITSQVAGMIVNGMFAPSEPVSLSIQPASVDSLEPVYTCAAASKLFSSYGVGSTAPNWTAHLSDAQPLFQSLDAISGIAPDSTDWHKSFDHYYDNLSARQCHAKALPYNINDTSICVTQDQADEVYRLGQYEYSFIYRDSPQSLQASTASYGVFMAELAQNIRDAMSGKSSAIYRHNVAHDGSVSRVLSILQVDVMVWVGMGSEIVFEVYSKKGYGNKRYLRILWGGQIMTSSNPTLGRVDMLDLDIFLAYIDRLVGKGASKVPSLCHG